MKKNWFFDLLSFPISKCIEAILINMTVDNDDIHLVSKHNTLEMFLNKLYNCWFINDKCFFLKIILSFFVCGFCFILFSLLFAGDIILFVAGLVMITTGYYYVMFIVSILTICPIGIGLCFIIDCLSGCLLIKWMYRFFFDIYREQMNIHNDLNQVWF